MAYRQVTDKAITVWKKQFDDEDNIRPMAVQQAIMQTTRLLFKVNIFVMLCNTLGQSMSMGTCDLSMLSKVTKDLDLSDIDWCGYVFDCLKDTNSAWNPNNKKGFYIEPIIFLLATDAGSVKISHGWFKATLSTIKEMHDMLMHQNKVLEDKINDTVKKYPENQLVKEWKNKLNDLFNEVSASDEPMQSQFCFITGEASDKYQREKRKTIKDSDDLRIEIVRIASSNAKVLLASESSFANLLSPPIKTLDTHRSDRVGDLDGEGGRIEVSLMVGCVVGDKVVMVMESGKVAVALRSLFSGDARET
ncbi:unnamed protein product [Lactuca saligna]|uniref:Uncharacterized protein n=1 Tax=Lactuca saligna TaxID=75948 RepID=A0AA35V0E2_LACSI|nr:unnamed protein product [Lactuca saligna]